jgi:hypothetical protein
VQTLSTLAVEKYGWVAKDIVDEVVHCGLGELATLAAGARETAGALDFLLEKLVNVLSVHQPRSSDGLNHHSLTLPSSPQRNRPGIQAQLIFSQ